MEGSAEELEAAERVLGLSGDGVKGKGKVRYPKAGGLWLRPEFRNCMKEFEDWVRPAAGGRRGCVAMVEDLRLSRYHAVCHFGTLLGAVRQDIGARRLLRQATRMGSWVAPMRLLSGF